MTIWYFREWTFQTPIILGIVGLCLTAAAADRTISREIPLDARYLLVPIGNPENDDYQLTISVDGELVHDVRAKLGCDKVDWWTHLDMSAYAGKTAVVTVDKPEQSASGLKLVETSAEPRNLMPLYDERLRPQLRFSQTRGWNNDPNGMVYHDGEYHFFWQSNPFANVWANMYWGHAVSRDLVHWEQLPYALKPRTMAKGECFSGSGHVDQHNTGGWQEGDRKAMILAFTDTSAGESLAVSTDNGRSWKTIPENPIIRHNGRDPKLLWYAYDEQDSPLDDKALKLGGHWVIVVYDEEPPHGRNFAFYTSTNLREWMLQSRLPGYFECPELFELPVDGNAADTRWIVFDVQAQYAVGRFDGRTFTPEHEGRRRLHWPRYVASQCFSNAPGGRVIQIGWVHAMDTPGMPFNQTFSLPGELSLVNTLAGVRMRSRPIPELEQLRGKPLAAAAGPLVPGKPLAIPCDGQLFDIEAEVEPGTASKITLAFGESRLVYDVAQAQLGEAALPLAGGRLQMRVITDRPMFEVWGGDGEVHAIMPRPDGGQPFSEFVMTAEGGEATVTRIRVHPLKSIWRP